MMTGKIDPILKARIDNLQDQIDLMDKRHPPGDKLYHDWMEARRGLVGIRARLINKT